MKKFEELKVNDIVKNKASGVKYKLTRKINDSIWEMVVYWFRAITDYKKTNLNFGVIIDYLNKNTFDEYEVKE